MRKPDLKKFEDEDIVIYPSNPTPEDFAEISKYIQTYKKKQALREKRKKANRKLSAAKAK